MSDTPTPVDKKSASWKVQISRFCQDVGTCRVTICQTTTRLFLVLRLVEIYINSSSVKHQTEYKLPDLPCWSPM